MDIERMMKISQSKINAGKQVRNVPNTLKEFKHGLQDVQEELSEVYKPIVKAQEEVKEAIDEKQDKMLEQLQKNQKALTSGLENLIMFQQLPDEQPQEVTKLPIGYKPAMMKPEFKSDVDKGFDKDEIQKLTKYELYPPSDVLKASIDGTLDFDKYDENIGKMLKKLGSEKANLSKVKNKSKNKEQVYELTKDINLLQKYRNRIKIIPEGKKTIGTGYTQPKRNAYKISSGGQYGNLMIDVPKLMGQLHLVAKKDGEKVLDKKVDFDTLDLLTKRFNSKKKYSDLSKMVFNQLNKLSEIPIHRTSKKFSKLGSGVVYYNDISDLVDRMELLGGAIMSGNGGARSEMSEIVHKLYEIGKIDNNQLNDLLKSYVIQV